MAQKFTVPISIRQLASAGSDALTVFVNGEVYGRIKIEAGGRISWSDGSGVYDTNLYRDSASVLKTDDTFKAAGLFVSGTEIDTTGAVVGDALVFNGTKFASASVAAGGASLTVSDTAPAAAEEGDLWFDSSTGQTFVYYDSYWVEIGGDSSGPTTLDELFDVSATSPSDGQVLTYISASSAWVASAPTGGASNLDELTDVNAPSPSSGDFLKWNGSAWINDPINLGTDTTGNYMSDVTQGTGVTITHTPGEGSNATIAIGQAVATSSSVTFAHISAPLTGNVIGSLSGNASTASALQNARTIQISGDISGSASFDGSSNINISTVVEPNSVALGADTTGNYVVDVVGGTGITVSHTPGEGSSASVTLNATLDNLSNVDAASPSDGQFLKYVSASTVWIPANIPTINNLDDVGDVTAPTPSSGDFLKWNGTAWINDPIDLGTDTTGNYVSDVTAGTGVTVTHTPAEGSSPTIAIGQAVATSSSVTFAHVTADVTGDLTGNADTASALQTARTIQLSGDVSGSASFDGTAAINISTTVNSGSVAIGELGDVVIASPEEYQVIQYDGTVWRNEYPDTVTYVRNVDSVTLSPGTAVYLFGGNGDHASVKRADNSSDTTSSKTIGLVGGNGITTNNNGPIVTRGYVDGIDLSAYNVGDVLWLGKNGAFTTTKPSAPDHLVFLGVVVRATNNGIIYVAAQNGYELEELHNVKINGVTDGQFLRYNSASAIWVNDTINLGTDTAGDYVQSLVAGTGVTLSNNSGEAATPTVAIGQSVATSASVTFAHLVVQGDMEVQGTITRLNETNLDVDEAFIYLNANSASANPDMGMAFNYNDGSYKHAGLFRDSSDGLFKIFDGYTPEPQTPIDTSHGSYNDASLQAKTISLTQTTGTAPLSVSSSTVVTNLNADKLDGQDGSYYAPINSPTFTGTVTLPNNTVALGTQTTGNYVADVSGGTGVTVTHVPGEGTTPSIAIGQAVGTSSSVQFAAVTAPLVGNASTATTLQNARAISLGGDLSGSASFDGSTNITITATVQPDSVALGTDTTGNYVQSLVAGNNITISNNSGEGATPTINSGMTISDTMPSSPTNGQVWYESDTGKTFVYYDSFWVEVSGGIGAQGSGGDSLSAFLLMGA